MFQVTRAALLLVGSAAVTFQQAPVFRTTTEAVPLLVAVADAAGEPVTDLKAEDFEVLDNGRPAEIVGFGPQPKPLAIALLAGHSPRMKKHAATAAEFVRALTGGLNSGEQMAVGGLQQAGLGGVSPFSSDHVTLLSEFQTFFVPMSYEPMQWWPAFGMANKALRVSADFTAPSYSWLRPGQPMWSTGQLPAVRSIVAISPGMDYEADRFGRKDDPWSDRYAHQGLLDGTVVYGIGFNGKGPDRRLSKLAPETSGWFTETGKKTDFVAEAARILQDLRTRYLLGFVPVSPDGNDHGLVVRVRRPGVVVRVRSTYRAPSLPLPSTQRR